ncbi:MAG: hypothetical protein ACPF8V_04930, partial [Luteibaculum sp.]
MNLFQSISKTLAILKPQGLFKVFRVLILTLVSGFFDVVGLAAILPIISIIVDESLIQTNY